MGKTSPTRSIPVAVLTGKQHNYVVLVFVYSEHFTDDCFEESSLGAQFGMKKEEVWSYSNHFSKCHSKIETVLLKERPRSAVEKRQV